MQAVYPHANQVFLLHAARHKAYPERIVSTDFYNMHWSVGEGIYGPISDTLETSWSEFAEFLRDAAELPLDPVMKDSHFWVTPMTQLPGHTSRQVIDIKTLGGWIGLDIDKGNRSLNDLRVKTTGLSVVIHSTASAQPDDQRWRVLIHLDRNYDVMEYQRIWRWFASQFDLDPSTKNANRVFFLPAKWLNGVNIVYCQLGRPVCVDNILAMVPLPPPPILPTTTIDTKPAPNRPMVTPHMMTNACSSKPGGRLFRMMCGVAKRHRLEGWSITAADLAHHAMIASALFAPGKTRPNIVREAQRAIDWATMNFATMTPLEKMRARILWERGKR